MVIPIIKKPELEKVIARLERIASYMWKLEMGHHGPEFTTDIGGLIISVRPYLERRPPISGGNFLYHSLTLQNREGNILIKYSSVKKKSIEEKEIKSFYDKIWENLKEDRNKEFTQLLNEFLSGQTSEKQSYTIIEKPELGKIISILEKIDNPRWGYKIGDFGPKFITRVNSLVFEVYKQVESIGLIKDSFYHTLLVKNTEGSVSIEYPDTSKKAVEKEEIKKFYENLYGTLIENKHKEFTQRLNELLLE